MHGTSLATTLTNCVGIFFAGIHVGLVVLLIALNMTVSVGTSNGLLFFIDIVMNLFIGGANYIPRYNTSKILWLKLDLGIPTRFYSGKTDQHKMGLQFAFLVYLLSRVIVIIVVCNIGQCRGVSFI